ncbi:hypothetical protein XENTR_v10011367 [Xenopus tropicalis]|nr:hypothetical protein XENTR_v10011367 [Xenopus tropicalis]
MCRPSLLHTSGYTALYKYLHPRPVLPFYKQTLKDLTGKQGAVATAGGPQVGELTLLYSNALLSCLALYMAPSCKERLMGQMCHLVLTSYLPNIYI